MVMGTGEAGQVRMIGNDGAEHWADMPAAAEVRVVFGDAPGNSLSLEVAATVLRLWHRAAPETMGMYVAEAICGTRPRTSTRASRAKVQ